jgi:hypothetical protein
MSIDNQKYWEGRGIQLVLISEEIQYRRHGTKVLSHIYCGSLYMR